MALVGADSQIRRGALDGSKAAAAVRDLLRFIGEDPERPGLADTPDRVCRSFLEMTAGYREVPAEILARTFDGEDYGGMVVLRNIEFHSLCEHHLLPFHGHASVAYIPDGGSIVGLSKLARLVHCFARRLQVQERLTKQIHDAINEHLKPLGAACIITAHHSCMSMRGVQCRNGEMITSELSGVFRGPAGPEFLRLHGRP